MTEALVRQYEPALRFAKGENFYPMKVDDYIAYCSLHAIEGVQGTMYVPPPYVTLAGLPDFGANTHYLVYADRRVEDEAKAEALRKWIERQKTTKGPDFGAFKRKLKDEAAKVGASLAQTFKPFHLRSEIFERALATYGRLADHTPAYYYRLVPDGAYTAIHYWFFYAFNDFATSHGGINDHEGDWEHILLFLKSNEPVWAAYSSHVGEGLALGRAWKDVEKEGDHPVVYVAAGSHANYHTPLAHAPDKAFVAGETVIGGLQGMPWGAAEPLDEPWFEQYRGRWGARQWDSQTHQWGDAHGGPPTGPKFNRDGTLRTQWERPVAYAGLV